MIRCPKCSATAIRVHGTILEGGWRRRWGFWGRVAPRLVAVGIECSCSLCLFAFISRPDGAQPAPVQSAYDRLQEAKTAITDGKGRTTKAENRGVSTPRPAPDPRVRRH